MDSVYKLSKYSQKIDEACRAKQLDKVMEYNKHELAYINKLSKYFGNQKGGATVDEVVKAVEQVLGEVAVVVEIKNNTIEDLKSQVSTLNEKNKKENDIHKQQLQKLDEERIRADEAMIRLSSECETTKEQLEAFNKANQAVKGKIEQFKAENQRLQDELLNQTSAKKLAEDTLTATKEEVEKLKEKLASAQQAQGQDQGQLQKLESEFKEILQEKDKKIQKAEKTNSDLQQVITDDRDRHAIEKEALQAEINRTIQELATAQQAQEDAKQIQQALQETVRELTAKVEEQQRQGAPGAQGGSRRKK
jgi:chromosome segregation ATPase